MKVSQALKAIEDFYIPGCVAWWAKQSQDLWQDAHDAFEKYILTKPSQSDLETQTVGFVDAIRECVEKYKAEGKRPNHTDLSDALVLGPDKLRDWDSVFNKRCYFCETNQDLILEPSGDNPELIRVACKAHKRK